MNEEEPEYYIDRVEECRRGNGRNPNKHKAIIRRRGKDFDEAYGLTEDEARANGNAKIERLKAGER